MANDDGYGSHLGHDDDDAVEPSAYAPEGGDDADGLDGRPMNLDEGFEPTTSAVMMLKRAWVRERLCPEMRAYAASTFEDVRTRTDARVEQLERRARERAEGGGGGAEEESEKLMDHLMWIEVNRVRYIMREYLRTRLHKIETHALHVLTDADTFAKLSETEQKFAEGYIEALQGHFEDVLKDLPEGYRDMMVEYSGEADEEATAQKMIPKPNLDAFVIFRMREDVPNFVQPNGETIELERGQVMLAQYSRFRDLLAFDPPKAELV